jgi:hypothetical protein
MVFSGYSGFLWVLWFSLGIIVLALAILPMLGVSGVELYHAESSGIANLNSES